MILTLDFEASCLPRHGRSYPIEVALAGGDRVQSWLIRPDDTWADWHWSDEAQALHGLSLPRIREEGLPVATVFAELVAAAQGHRIVADSVIDQYWLEALADAAGQPVPFMIDHISLLLDEERAGERAIAAAVAAADARHPERHRAGVDALWLSALLDHVMAAPKPAFALEEAA